MTALPPDPDPMDTPSEERAGGVPPGEISPQSAQTSASKNADHVAGRNLNPRAIIGVVAVLLFVLIFAAVAVGVIIQM
ncbi:DUF6480 family protein [Mycolicibacterium rufum]|uniref:DUF6480 family protein n=1 Tax=Mycolicibacterium rufum TaxID=318424 RepID=A0A9X2YDA6_9MYCO|nr:DUF6480 family protein [Mycolicibacterium rufum]KGI66822.1 hypothetical protein EU78_04340 [Mycolicibacterium rufum]MCV7070581.1 hypothetical protein [Mycolicibacterium rufum]ULP37637.1 DUF6480 family protein [Mycolicibacterium rufum]